MKMKTPRREPMKLMHQPHDKGPSRACSLLALKLLLNLGICRELLLGLGLHSPLAHNDHQRGAFTHWWSAFSSSFLFRLHLCAAHSPRPLLGRLRIWLQGRSSANQTLLSADLGSREPLSWLYVPCSGLPGVTGHFWTQQMPVDGSSHSLLNSSAGMPRSEPPQEGETGLELTMWETDTFFQQVTVSVWTPCRQVWFLPSHLSPRPLLFFAFSGSPFLFLKTTISFLFK